jgi:hypothetical protein
VPISFAPAKSASRRESAKTRPIRDGRELSDKVHEPLRVRTMCASSAAPPASPNEHEHEHENLHLGPDDHCCRRPFQRFDKRYLSFAREEVEEPRAGEPALDLDERPLDRPFRVRGPSSHNRR